MKSLAISLFLLLFATNCGVFAQKSIRFGVKAGYSIATQYGIPVTDNTIDVGTKSRNGFTGGLFAYIPITEAVGIQHEWLYTMKGSRQSVSLSQPFPINSLSEYNINYFEMPILLKYRFVKLKNFGIYASTGIALSLLLKGDYKITTTVNAGGPPTVLEESGKTDGLDTFDYSFVYGAGTDFKLFKRDFFLDLRMTIGWNTLAMPNAKGADPVPLRNQSYVIGLGTFF